MKVYKKDIIVTQSAIDQQNHVNNLVYLQWCLETAQEHWDRNSQNHHSNLFFWVVMQHQINYRAEAFLNDQLEVKTWIDEIEGAKCTRKYSILKKSDQKIIVEASTLWCLLDKETKKPTKIPQEIIDIF